MQVESESNLPELSRSKALIAAALGGLIASFAMGEFSSLFPRTQNDSQSADEDSTVKAASAISEAIFRHRLTATQKPMAGIAVHYTFGTTMGAVYGVLAGSRKSKPLGWGLPFGASIWLGAHVIAVPALRLSKPIPRNAVGTEAIEFASHLVYGGVVEGVRRTLQKYVLC